MSGANGNGNGNGNGHPSPNGGNGRNSDGTFSKGNKGGPGNPFGAKFEEFRARIVAVVTADDCDEVIRVLIREAKKGKPWAVKEFFDRVMGKAKETIQVQHVEAQDALAILNAPEVSNALELARQRRIQSS